MLIQFKLPDDFKEAVCNNENFSGSVYIKLIADEEADKKKQRKKERHKQLIKECSKLKPSEYETINFWNQSSKQYQKDFPDQQRNLPHKSNEQVPTNLRGCLKKLTTKEIQESIQDYFNCCSKGECFWSSKNHAFLSLKGFLSSLQRAQKTKKPPWWQQNNKAPEMKDPNKELTQQIADEFAKRFCKRKQFGLVNPSREYRSFMKTASRIKKIEGQRPNWKADWLIQKLFLCIEEAFSNNTITHPATLCSDYVWKTLLSQVLN